VTGAETLVRRACSEPRLGPEAAGEHRAVSGGHSAGSAGPRIRSWEQGGTGTPYRVDPPVARAEDRHRAGGGLRAWRARATLRARCTRMRVITAGSVINTRMRSGAAQRGQASGLTS